MAVFKFFTELRCKAASILAGDTAFRAYRCVHVSCWAADIINYPVKARQMGDMFGFPYYGFGAAGNYPSSLVRGYGAETALAEASPMRGNGLFYCLYGAYLASLVERVGIALVVKFVYFVKLGGRKRRLGGLCTRYLLLCFWVKPTEGSSQF